MAFKKIAGDTLVTYEMQAALSLAVAEQLVGDIKAELEKAPKWDAVVFDFKGHDLDYKALKSLTPMGLELRKLNKKFFALSESPGVHALIKSEGLKELIKPISSLGEIPGQAAAKRAAPKLDVSFINPFIEGTIHVLNVQCQTVATPQKPILKSASTVKFKTDIAGIIGITSASFKGSISICFSAEVFLELMSKMLGEECKVLNDDVKDGAAEITNMIFGHAKTKLNEKGHTIEKALPTVASGLDLTIDHSRNSDSIILPFLVGDKTFFMEIGIEKE